MEAVAPEIISTPRDARVLRQRAWRFGLRALDTSELIAIVVGGATRDPRARELADSLLDACGGLPVLSRSTPRELALVNHTGSARAIRLAAAFELGRRAIEFTRERELVGGPADVHRLVVSRVSGLSQEVFIVIGVDIRNCLIDVVEVARGTLVSVGVHPREVFRPLIRMAAAGAVVVHNHPSGDPEPSPDDLDLTRRLREVGSLIGIPIIDHVIVGEATFRSLSSPSRDS